MFEAEHDHMGHIMLYSQKIIRHSLKLYAILLGLNKYLNLQDMFEIHCLDPDNEPSG